MARRTRSHFSFAGTKALARERASELRRILKQNGIAASVTVKRAPSQQGSRDKYQVLSVIKNKVNRIRLRRR